MIASNQFALLFLGVFIGSGTASDPHWSLGTTAESAALRPSAELRVPVYSPAGLPFASLPSLQRITLQGTERAIVGLDKAYVVDSSTQAPPKNGVLQHLHSRLRETCPLEPGQEVLYYEKHGALHVLDTNGEICRLPVVRQQPIETAKKSD